MRPSTDRGYGSSQITQSLKEQGIKPYILDWSTIENAIASGVLPANTSLLTRAIIGTEHGTLLHQVLVVIAPGFELCGEESAEITSQSIRAPTKRSGPVRRSAGPNERVSIR